MKLKKCTKCGKEKPLTDFAYKDRKKDRRQYHCRECRRNYYIAYKNNKLPPAKRKKVIPPKRYIRRPDCADYSRCLSENALNNTEFTCGKCAAYRYEKYSMMTLDDMSGIMLLLAAVFGNRNRRSVIRKGRE